MNWLWFVILGAAIGWAVEWVIDWLYWRQRSASGTGELENLQAQNRRLRADLDTANSASNKLRADVGSLEASLSAAKSDSARLRAEVEALSGSANQYKLELGGLSERLAAAEHANERLHAQLNVGSGVTAHLNDQVGQLQAQLATAQTKPVQLRTLADGGEALAVGGSGSPERDQYKTQLFSVADLSAAESASASDELARLRGDLSGATSEIERLRAELAGLRSRPARDPLIDINGIGPVIEKRMFDAGIFTFAQLAEQAPERLRQIARLQDWQDADPNAWVAEARERAAGKGQG